jgi:SPP1 family predicted phage head-tail adaptor
MSAGRRRHRIVIEQPQVTADPVTNEQVETWVTFATVWAGAEDKPAKEFHENGQFHARSLTVFEVLRLSVVGVNERMRIQFDGSTYNIVAIRTGTLRREMMWLEAERVV